MFRKRLLIIFLSSFSSIDLSQDNVEATGLNSRIYSVRAQKNKTSQL